MNEQKRSTKDEEGARVGPSVPRVDRQDLPQSGRGATRCLYAEISRDGKSQRVCTRLAGHVESCALSSWSLR